MPRDHLSPAEVLIDAALDLGIITPVRRPRPWRAVLRKCAIETAAALTVLALALVLIALWAALT